MTVFNQVRFLIWVQIPSTVIRVAVVVEMQ